MAQHFDFVVVGKGMMGAAAARYLARSGAGVALIGPGEPADWKTHDGVFASHYDNGRITRTIDADPDWALLANRSIARYRAIEAESGISFYNEAGCLITGPSSGSFVGAVASVATRFALDAPVMDRAALAARFPWFSMPGTSAGVFEASGAGHLDPRKLVAAQAACTERSGGTLIGEEVVAVKEGGDRVTVRLRTGDAVTADRVLVAAGGFSRAPDLLPRVPALIVKARTVVFAEIPDEMLDRYRDMPSWIDESADPTEHFYLLPPVLYPDGKHYIKIGGDPSDVAIEDEAAIRDWFRGQGGPEAIAHLTRVLRRAVPDLVDARMTSAPCVTTYTEHGYPYAGFVESDRIALLTGGNGAAAKSSDEIGRIGADLLLKGRLDEPDYQTDFSVRFR
jgi:glycine/D-amino acid oxidase-like deaminating enzyme